MKNNFDTSSSGVNIEFNIDYDHWQGQSDYKENFVTLCEDWRKDITHLYFTDYGNLEGPTNIFDLFDFSKLKKAELVELADRYLGNDYFNFTKQELLDEAFHIPLSEIPELLKDGYEFKKGVEMHRSVGYSQGDVVYVIYDKAKLKEVWGAEPDIKRVNKSIDNFLWDLPISFYLSVDDDQDFHWLDWCDEDGYSYDKDVMLNCVKKAYSGHIKSEIIVKFMEENLPLSIC